MHGQLSMVEYPTATGQMVYLFCEAYCNVVSDTLEAGIENLYWIGPYHVLVINIAMRL